MKTIKTERDTYEINCIKNTYPDVDINQLKPLTVYTLRDAKHRYVDISNNDVYAVCIIFGSVKKEALRRTFQSSGN